jgi:hypothetical protein
MGPAVEKKYIFAAFRLLFMLTRLFPLLFCLFASGLSAQVTLVKGAPSETFDLGCATCRVTVADMAIVPGHQVLPYNLMKEPPKVNLMHWRYFDRILNRQAVWPRPLLGEDCVLLLHDLAPSDTVSLHINLMWQSDSTAPIQRIFLVVAGIQRQDFDRLPLSAAYSDDLFVAMRLSAIAQITVPPTDAADGYTETYQITEGSFTLESIDFMEDHAKGNFKFLTDRIGIAKTGVFINGVFKR